jgi:hypothetical protein
MDLDAPLNWDCSSRGWHCCVDKGIPLTPYDLIRLRHSTGQTSQQLIDHSEVTFQWRGGLMAAWLAQVPYEGNHRACTFYEELSNTDIARIRDEDPDRFANLPPTVQRAADRLSGGSYRVAGLCGVHMNRPEACRAFPFMLRPDWPDDPEQATVEEVHRCGTCALSARTTVRQVMLENRLDEFWRPAHAWREVKLYLVSRGLAHANDPKYRSLTLDLEQRTALWSNCFNPDSLDAVAERFPDQWRLDADLEGDDQILRLVLNHVLDRTDEFVAEGGANIEELGLIDDSPMVRPDLEALLDPSRPVLPVITSAVDNADVEYEDEQPDAAAA